MKKKICLLVLLLLPSLAAAAPSVKGSTGNIDTPSADVLRPGQASIGYYHMDEGKSAVGAVSVGKNIEISAAYTEDTQNDNFTKVNIKYALTQEAVFAPG
ncbi:MAG: YjbH domain-containing protein, partial [Selenomonadaceae bacterium]